MHREASAIEPPIINRTENERMGSCSPEPSARLSATARDSTKKLGIRRPSGPSLDYSGDEVGPYSDFSDTPPQSLKQTSPLGFLIDKTSKQATGHHQTPYAHPLSQQQPNQLAPKNASQASGFQPERQDEERVIWHGYLLYLKSKGGVRQWKRSWVVLRLKNLAFYKNDEVRETCLSNANQIVPNSPIGVFCQSYPPSV